MVSNDEKLDRIMRMLEFVCVQQKHLFSLIQLKVFGNDDDDESPLLDAHDKGKVWISNQDMFDESGGK